MEGTGSANEQATVQFVVDRLEAVVEQFAASVESLNRTIQGSPAEGNKGILPRIEALEKRVERLWWTFPFLVTGGTALGNWVSNLLS